MKIFIGIILVFFLSGVEVFGAEVYGIVYGSGLEKMKDVIIEIDSSPVQRMVAKEGEFSFEVKSGRNYTVTAKADGRIVGQDELSVIEEGRFVVDLILLPDFSEDISLLEELDDPDLDASLFSEDGTKSFWVWILVLGLIGSGGAYVIRRMLRRKSKEQHLDPVVETGETERDVEKIRRMLKENGGRMMQKELRKCFPLSEAKVSLMITELEAKGVVEKIKRGRGNLIILKEKDVKV